MFVFYFHAFVFHALRLIVAFLLNRALALPQPLSHPRLITVQLLQQPCLSLYLPAFSRVPFFYLYIFVLEPFRTLIAVWSRMRWLDSCCWGVSPYDSFCNRSAIGWQYLLCLIPGRVKAEVEVEVRCAMVVWVRLFPAED